MSTTSMSPQDGYKTIHGETRSEITIKRSVFHGCCRHVTSKDEALRYVDELKAEFHDAVHHCWAYRLGKHGLEYRAVDDGEPYGSAGKPILFSMLKADVSDVIVVVVRYFGGIKLGVGGLARAYADAATDVLALSPRTTVMLTQPLTVYCTYDDIARVTMLLDEMRIDYVPTYADTVTFDVDVPESLVAQLQADVIERTSGRGGSSIRR
ncbi:MAG: YigZ family protein [Candidatus Kapabacteria bacterium]|nr:YigZ family protein [Candidatus Kapabacteria bacterium]